MLSSAFLERGPQPPSAAMPMSLRANCRFPPSALACDEWCGTGTPACDWLSSAVAFSYFWEFNFRVGSKCSQLKDRAKSQRPRTKSRLFLTPLRPIQWRMSCAGNTPFFRAHFQSTRGRGSWDPNGRPQSTELQAVLGFPPDSQL